MANKIKGRDKNKRLRRAVSAGCYDMACGSTMTIKEITILIFQKCERLSKVIKTVWILFVIVVGFFRPVFMIVLGWPLYSGVTSVHPLSCLNLLVFDRILLSYCSLNEVNSLHLVSIPLIEKSLDL